VVLGGTRSAGLLSSQATPEDMAMNRREFVKYLAGLSAGVAALPAQLEAFEHYFEINTPNAIDGLIGVDEIWVSGIARVSWPLEIRILHSQAPLILGLNAFGGIMRWSALPEQKLMATTDLEWKIKNLGPNHGEFPICGHIGYVDQNGRRRTKEIKSYTGTLGD
jgi:hypothetical protein